MKYLSTTAWLIFVFLFGACTTGPSPQEILAKTHDSMRQVQSYRFSDETVQETEDGVLRVRVTGVWASPNRWYMKVEPLGEFAGRVSETVVIGQRLFTRESGSDGGAWREAAPFPAGYNVYNPRPESYLAIPDLENVQLLDDDTVEGMAVFQISGVRRETRTLPPRLPQQPEGEEAEFVTTFTWLIAKEDYRLVRRITEQHIGPATYRTTTNFYGYDKRVDIEIPELAEQ